MELSKDIYLYLTRFADDKTILNMLSVNKKYNNEKFFEQVMRRKYPLLIKFKKEYETWKKFFMGMFYCIAKIEETHGVPYYPVEGYNPKLYCNKSKQNILNDIMLYAAKNGQKDIVEIMIQKGSTVFNKAMVWTAASGHKDMVEYMIQKGADKFNVAIIYAAYYGHKHIVELLIQNGATNFDEAMAIAARGGQKDIVELMIQNGAANFDEVMVLAARGGHKDIVELMIQKGATDFDEAMVDAAQAGHKDIVDYLKSIFM